MPPDTPAPYVGVVSFQDGREGIKQEVVERSTLLKSVLGAAATAPGKEQATVDLSRASFQFWVQTALRPASIHKLSDTNLIKLIQVRGY